ncbi:MAG: LytR/AlgR family response regulator transcription factor [Verrucomicrobiota bacterium]
MDRLKALIVDDEPLARERLRGMLEAAPAVEVVGECADGVEVLTAARFARPDVVFLDIQMPGQDGLQVAVRLRNAGNPAIVFTTGHDRFALDAFAVAAVDYLLKPFDRDRLLQAVNRVREHRQPRPPGEAPAPAPGPRSERLAFRADGRIVFLRTDEIQWVEAEDNYVTLHLVAGRLMLRETLAAVETRLGAEEFLRINRSAIVRLDQIKELQPALHGDYTVVLRDGPRLRLSRTLRSRFDRLIGGEK